MMNDENGRQKSKLKSQSSKVKTQNYNSKVKTELFFEMNKFLVLR
jgi:hypothetical protein